MNREGNEEINSNQKKKDDMGLRPVIIIFLTGEIYLDIDM